MSVDTQPPGPGRLFPVEANGDPMNVIVGDPYRVVLSTDTVAAAAISAAGEAARLEAQVWIVSPDRWHAAITPTDIGFHIDGTATAPLDAIRRAISHIETPQQGANQ